MQRSIDVHMLLCFVNFRYVSICLSILSYLSMSSCCYTDKRAVRRVCVLDGLVEQRNSLIDEIESVKEERELAIGALNVAHELSMQSVNERCERHLATQLAAGQ